MKPTLTAIIIFFMLIIIALGLMVINEAWLIGSFVLTGAFLIAFLLDGYGSRPDEDFLVRWRMPKMIYIGAIDYFEVELTVSDHWRPQLVEVAVDHDENLEEIEDFFVSIDPHQMNTFNVDLTPLRRGNVEIDAIWLKWSGRLGLVTWTKRFDVNEAIPVIPNIKAVSKDALMFSSRDALFGFKPQWQLGDGSEFDALREYVPGFDPRSIDWKSSARHNKLICKEFQTERNHQIILAYDTGYLMMEPVDGIVKMDHAVNAGLLLSYLSLKNGDKVGLLSFNSKIGQYLSPVSGVQNFAKIQQVSSSIDYSNDEANYTIAMTELLTRLNRRSLIIMITDFVDTVTADLMVDNLERIAKKHLIVFVSLKDKNLHKYANREIKVLDDLSEAVLAQDFISEREVVIEKLMRLGVQCIDTTIENLKVDILNKYLHIKLREMI